MEVIALLLCFLFPVMRIGTCENSNVFPEYFKFGVASAAFQIEGGWNASGKGESMWDRLTHVHPELILDHTTGDVACDSYNQWKTDVEILKELKVDFYRFSLSWPRILPNGYPNEINPDGLRYYNGLIDELLANGIEPMVTLYHWDLPQTLQELGGWTSLRIPEYFAEYSRVAFENFGDRVKLWITINEPMSICEETYGLKNGAPPENSPGVGDYICGHNVLLAHSKAYRVYDEEFREKQSGKIGITIDSIWAEARTNRSQDIEAAERELQFNLGWFAHPIFSKSGDYPDVMKERIENRSVLENFVDSRLPSFSNQQVLDLRGSADFLGLNHYHTWLISDHEYEVGQPSFTNDKGTKGYQDPRWKPNINTVPWGFYKLLKWIKKEYENPLVYITENGFPDAGNLNDTGRVVFHAEFLKALLRAVNEGCNVRAYAIWSILDNMEWRSGYTIKYGIYHVNFSDPKRTRRMKSSARFYRNVIETRNPSNDFLV